VFNPKFLDIKPENKISWPEW